MDSFSLILTGSSGMVGRAVLLECLAHPAVTRVLLVNRHPVDLRHPKLSEVLHADFSDVEPIRDRLAGYDACFFCAGVSSVGKDEAEYTRLTYDLVTGFARTLRAVNPELVFTYVSGMGTDAGGRQMWARVKGRTEEALLGMGFRDAYMFRLGLMLPERKLPMQTKWVGALYGLLRPVFPLLRRFSWSVSDRQLGRAMINCVQHPRPRKVLESADIGRLGDGA
ncbi:NAD-dependent epimerase/dehydratase family protein [Lewinella sp. IMCC34183]|uniref:NAD-dependent epimerase/dehydratase family protein n=1 Tax=Lewinella sp. IMCC34183 TaxID=2248762 RepID=UPI000E23786C|nr:NAD-dependent epimerase/dehydratase family protein [Lewinella sp. IMCC34183]